MLEGHALLPGFELVGHASQTSPFMSPSLSSCDMFAMFGQLSVPFATPSPSRSFGSNAVHTMVFAFSGQTSHTSPTPSRSASAWTMPSIGRTGLKTIGQLSLASLTPSLSRSVLATVYVVEPWWLLVALGLV